MGVGGKIKTKKGKGRKINKKRTKREVWQKIWGMRSSDMQENKNIEKETGGVVKHKWLKG